MQPEPEPSTGRHSSRGGSLIEYMFLVLLIAVACITALTAFGLSVGENVDDSSDRIQSSFSP